VNSKETITQLVKMKSSILVAAIVCLCKEVHSFSQIKSFQSNASSRLHAVEDSSGTPLEGLTRRRVVQQGLVALPALIFSPRSSLAGTFTPGGTLVDRDVGVTVGNGEASTSRKVDNSNVLFSQDNYFKFGVAAPWIEADSTEFPKTMPFVLSQQRYDSLKKYGSRVKAGAQAVNSLEADIKAGNFASITNGDDPKYALRPLGLMANGFLASENTGTTNELLLARWYINEVYLRLSDMSKAASENDALVAYSAAKKSLNSYFAMLNRVVTSKVGDKFEYL
jgi:hypothetical protein